jgi:hypothetical protein
MLASQTAAVPTTLIPQRQPVASALELRAITRSATRTALAIIAPIMGLHDRVRGMEYRRALVNWSTGVLLVLVLPFMVWISHDYGATWDEPRRHQHGIRVVE